MRHGRYPFIIGFLAAPVTLYVVFVLGPYAQAFYMAMTNWRGISANPQFIGLENFERLFDDDVFWKAVRHHGVLLIALPLITIVLGLFFAFMLNVGGRVRHGGMAGVWGSRFYRVVFFLPQVLAVAIIAVLFQAVYRPDETGVLNAPITALGFEPIPFLVDPDIALWSIIGVLVWQAVGFYVVLFSAGIASIPADIFEAAALDGVNRFTLFFRIVIPLLWDNVQVAFVYLGIIALDFFAIVNIMTPHPEAVGNSTEVIAHYLFTRAFSGDANPQYGYASAIGVALFFLTLTLAAVMFRASRREKVEF